MGKLTKSTASDPLQFEAGDDITLEIRGREGIDKGFYGGIRDDGGEVLFLFVGEKLARCYWPAEQADMLRIKAVPTEKKKCRKKRSKAQ